MVELLGYLVDLLLGLHVGLLRDAQKASLRVSILAHFLIPFPERRWKDVHCAAMSWDARHACPMGNAADQRHSAGKAAAAAPRRRTAREEEGSSFCL